MEGGEGELGLGARALSCGARRQQATEPLSSHARMLFHSLLALLDERLGSLGLGDEDFMLKHNLRKARRDLQVGSGAGGGSGLGLRAR